MLRTLRIQNGYKQVDVAHELHIDRSVVAKWESGKARPSLDVLMPLAHMYRVSVERLIEILTEGGERHAHQRNRVAGA